MAKAVIVSAPTDDPVAKETKEAKRRSCSLEGFRFIVEQVAALDISTATFLDLDAVIAQAKFALQSERELRLDALREQVDTASDPCE